jgi:DNA-binding NtrC family response regulator
LELDFLAKGDFETQTFRTGEEFLAHLDEKPDVIVLDYHLDGIEAGAMNGMQVLDCIKKVDSKLPVIILSSQDKIEVAVDCMLHLADDYVVKSETAFLRIQKDIKAFQNLKLIEKQLNWYMDRM